MVDASQPTFAMNRGRRLACAVGAMAWSEFYCVGNRFDPGPGASVVGFTPRRARYAYSTEHHAAGLDDQSAAGGQESRKITQPAHRLSRLRVGGKRSGWGTKTGRCPSLVGCDVNSVRAREAVAKHGLSKARPINDGDGNLIALLPT